MLNQLIHNLNKEEVRHFKLFLNRTTISGDRKDVELFDYIRKSRDAYNEDKILNKLYPNKSKNAFYRLKNRLIDVINKSLAIQYFDETEEIHSLHYLLLSRHFQNKRLFHLAERYLKKAERKGEQSHNYNVLEMIYSDYIKLSQETLPLNPETYIQRRKDIRKRINQLNEIDDVLAALMYRVKTSQNLSKTNKELLSLLEKIIAEYSFDKTLQESPSFKFKIYNALSRILLQRRDFIALEKYLIETYASFNAENLFTKAHFETKFQMLTYLANSLVRNKKYQESLKYCEILLEQLDDVDVGLKTKYLFYYYNISSVNYSKLNQRKQAIELVSKGLENPELLNLTLHRVGLTFNLALLHFDLHEYKKANRSILKILLDDNFSELDEGFRLKIHIAELIVRYELNKTDYIEKQIKYIQKDFKEILKDKAYKRQLLMLELLQLLIFSDGKTSEKANEVRNKLISQNEGFDDLLNYSEWLKSKRSSL